MVVEYPELRLVWPPTLFRTEAVALLQSGSTDTETLGWLLAEAFAVGRAAALFDQLQRQQRIADLASAMNAFGSGGTQAAAVTSRAVAAGGRTSDSGTDLVRQLIETADTLPRLDQRRYYPARHGQRPLTLLELTGAFGRLARELTAAGYFTEAFGSCADERGPRPEAEGQRQLAAALLTEAPLWPFERDGAPTGVERSWDKEMFFGVIEALHDRVARPRRRIWDKSHRHYHYAWFARRPGQAVYRWRVNELLGRSEVTLRLAESGPDVGLLVETTGDARDDLVEQALATPNPRDREATRHAVALFRGRGASREEKRSAAAALARVLEDRRALLKEALFSKDEGALFTIANEFDIRHRGVRGAHGKAQQEDYADAFLDWVFWWYLATVELTDRLLVAQDSMP